MSSFRLGTKRQHRDDRGCASEIVDEAPRNASARAGPLPSGPEIMYALPSPVKDPGYDPFERGRSLALPPGQVHKIGESAERRTRPSPVLVVPASSVITPALGSHTEALGPLVSSNS